MNKKRVISVLLAFGVAGILSTGTTLAIEAVSSLVPPKIITTVTKPEPTNEGFEIILADGTAYLSTQEQMPNYIQNQEYISINGTIYSENKQKVMQVIAEYENSSIIQKETYILTIEEYINNLDETLNKKPGYKRHSAKLIETKTLSELYGLTEEEQPYTNKLTK